MMVKVTLFKESGKYYTEEDWRVPENALSPHDMYRSEDFRRIGKGAVLVQSQEPWGYPCLLVTCLYCNDEPEPNRTACANCAPYAVGASTTRVDGTEPPAPPHSEAQPIPNSRKRLADYLSEYAHNVVEEWMRIVDICADVEEPGSSEFQACVTWAEDGTFALGLRPYESDLGQYRLTVNVDALPDPPPMGPENDPAQWHEAIEYGEEQMRRAGLSEIEPQEPAPEWVPTQWRFVLANDHVRIGQQEATVTTSSVGEWHADNTDPYHPKPWNHTEVRVRLEHLGEKMLEFPPALPVEILMNRERQAVHLLQTASE